MFAPTLPSDLLVNVYINLNKLCLTVYQLHTLQPTSTKVKVLPTSRRPHTSTAEDPPHRPHGLCCFCLEFPPRRRRSAPQSWRHVVSAQKGLLEPLLSYSLCPWGLGPGLPSGIHFLSFPSEWGSQRLEVSHVHKVECVIPWLNDALVYFTVSLQLCQQLKDKVCAGAIQGTPPTS